MSAITQCPFCQTMLKEQEPVKKTCQTCAVWSALEGTSVGQCRIKPPGAIIGFPETRPDQWCGEWREER